MLTSAKYDIEFFCLLFFFMGILRVRGSKFPYLQTCINSQFKKKMLTKAFFHSFLHSHVKKGPFDQTMIPSQVPGYQTHICSVFFHLVGILFSKSDHNGSLIIK